MFKPVLIPRSKWPYDAGLKDGGRGIREFKLWGRMAVAQGKLVEAVAYKKLTDTLTKARIY